MKLIPAARPRRPVAGSATSIAPAPIAPVVLATFALLVSGTAAAATQGSLVNGGRSSGSINVGIDKIQSVQISGLEDVAFGEHAYTDTGFTSNESFCVYSSTGTFDLTMESANAGGGPGDAAGGSVGTALSSSLLGTPAAATAMRMAGDAGNAFMAYTITLDGDAAPLQSGTPRTGLAGDRQSQTCGGTDNVAFTVAIDADAFNEAPPGAYSDVLTMFVEPR